MARKKLNVALIGYGFMGRAHSNAYRKVNQFFDLGYEPVMKVACARNAEKLGPFAERWGWQETATDWRSVVARDDIDLIDICSPNDTHMDIAIAAAQAGKMIACEKPLARTTEEARAMTEAMEKAGRPNMVWFNYRRVPALALAKQMVDEGRIGRVFHYRAKYLQDWTISPDVPQGGATLWRLDVDVAGSGVTGDLLAHSIDLARWLNGDFASVSAMTETFVKERALQDHPDQRKPVGIDDACAFLARFQNGSLGTFESTRYARGRKNHNTLEINGEKGSIAFDLEYAHELEYFEHGGDSHVRGWRKIHVWDADHPYMANWWVPGCAIGYEHTFINQVADFLQGLDASEKRCPDFRDGLATQVVCDRVLASGRSSKWEVIPTL
ncbi:MAG: Gfo/Idh/MocA family oxidoreductase [Planctomycetes bacterium]|nr:Gfo/Idh/MocA family oxidoreductase [Planctomycetota bacterium]